MILSIAGICLLFLCPSLLWAYRRGLKDGLALNKGAPTFEPIPTPSQYLAQRAEVKATKQQEDLMVEGVNNLFEYDPLKPKGGE